MKRRLLLMALVSLPAVALAARISTRGAGKAGGPLDPRRQDGTLGGNEEQDAAPAQASDEKKESGEGKTEASSQKESTD